MTKITARDAIYLAAIANYKGEIPEKYLRDFCPECGEENPTTDYHVKMNLKNPNGYILERDDIIVIGCEGYQMIPPHILGIHCPGWDDWTDYLEGWE